MEDDEYDNDNGSGAGGRDGRLVKPVPMDRPASRDKGFNNDNANE